MQHKSRFIPWNIKNSYRSFETFSVFFGLWQVTFSLREIIFMHDIWLYWHCAKVLYVCFICLAFTFYIWSYCPEHWFALLPLLLYQFSLLNVRFVYLLKVHFQKNSIFLCLGGSVRERNRPSLFKSETINLNIKNLNFVTFFETKIYGVWNILEPLIFLVWAFGPSLN